MTLFISLLLTHFIADYPLQWGALIRLKQKNYLGVLLHCLIHLGVMLFVMHVFLYEVKVFWAILFIFFSHNIIDQGKVMLDKSYPQYRLYLYLLDQLAHIVIVTCMALWLGPLPPRGFLEAFYQNGWVMLYFLVLVWGTYFYDVTRYFVQHRHPDGSHYQRDYKGILWHALTVTGVFGGLGLLKVLGVWG